MIRESDIHTDYLRVTFTESFTIAESSVNTCDSLQASIDPDRIIVRLTELVYAGSGSSGGRTHVDTEFTAADVTEFPWIIGIGETNKKIFAGYLQILEPFDGDVVMTIGLDDAQGIIMIAEDNRPQYEGLYSAVTNLNTSRSDLFKVFFYFTTKPTTGRATVTLFFG